MEFLPLEKRIDVYRKVIETHWHFQNRWWLKENEFTIRFAGKMKNNKYQLTSDKQLMQKRPSLFILKKKKRWVLLESFQRNHSISTNGNIIKDFNIFGVWSCGCRMECTHPETNLNVNRYLLAYLSLCTRPDGVGEMSLEREDCSWKSSIRSLALMVKRFHSSK